MYSKDNQNTPNGNYEFTPATARLLDCLRASSALYDTIGEAMQQRYGEIMTPEEVDAKTEEYLRHINAIDDMLHKEVGAAVVDALSDTKNTAADIIKV